MDQKTVAHKPKEHFPAERLAELGTFINRLNRISYFRPDGNPKKEWKMFYAPTWGEALNMAVVALDKRDLEAVSRNGPSIENISLSAANQEAKVFTFSSPEFFDNTAWSACHVAQEAVKAATTGWEWNKKRYNIDEEGPVEIDTSKPRPEGAIKAEVANALVGFLRNWQREIIEMIGNPTARESAIESAGQDAWAMGRLILAEKHPYFHRERHITHINSRIEVWEKGYGLAGDDSGTLYVYCRGSPPKV
jgi:hypothetical protein